MNFYPDDVIEEVRLNNDLVSVVSEYIHLERKGGSFFGLCPFHREKTPSFSVEPTKQFYYCFGCSNGGNVFHFIMHIENLDFVEALRFLADRAGMVLPEPDNKEEQHKIKLRKDILTVNREAARFFYTALAGKNGSRAQQYLYSRGIGIQTIKRFGLGFALDDWSALSKALMAKGYGEDILISSGLSLKNKNGKLNDRFRNRIMFPIFDLRGNVVAFGGRVMDDTLPKYINSPETLCYSKGRELYGMHLAKKSLEKKLLIVEGYMDVISLHQAGIDFAVASLGTALTNMQGRVLKKYAEEIIISYDTDTAGRKATNRGIEVLDQLGCRAKVLQIPEGKDPDEFIRKNGPEKFKNLVDRAISHLEYKIRQLKLKFPTDNPDGKLAFLNGVADLLTEKENILEREMVMKNISRDYDITIDTLQAEVERRLNQKKRKEKRNEFNQKKRSLTGSIGSFSVKRKDGPRETHEHMLLTLLSRENHLYSVVSERYPVSSYSEGSNREMAEVLYQKLSDGNDFLLEEYITKLEPAKAAMIVGFSKDCNFEEPEKAIEDILKKLETIKLREEMKDIQAQLKNINDVNEEQRLKRQLQEIIQRMCR
ncbi:MAG: DNA primase [Clostridiaceae bacterium]|nr:DNA primase [Clostridiaceae bacterium]